MTAEFGLFCLVGILRNCVPDHSCLFPRGPLGLDDPVGWSPPSSISPLSMVQISFGVVLLQERVPGTWLT